MPLAFAAGVRDGDDVVLWSRHRTERAAVAAAMRYGYWRREVDVAWREVDAAAVHREAP
jgi:hypothetical protein